MSSTPLHDIWEAAASNPFHPTISKDSQFFVGFSLLLAGMIPNRLHQNEATIKTYRLLLDRDICAESILCELASVGIAGFDSIWVCCMDCSLRVLLTSAASAQSI